MINSSSSFRRFADLLGFYLLVLHSLSFSANGSAVATTTSMSVTCGTDVELTCPIRSLRKSDEVISWFRPNSSSHSRLSFISIGDILLPEYAVLGRFNLIPSPSSMSRLFIANVLMDDQGYYKCKSSSTGQHSIKLTVHSHPHLLPSSPILLYPVNRTFSMTCALLCDASIDIDQLVWLVNDRPLTEEKYKFHVETISANTQRLTIFLHSKVDQLFNQANFTCRYNGKESSLLVRRRTREELHRLPRQQGSSSAYLLQAATDTGHRHSHTYLMLVSTFATMITRAI